MALYDAEIAYDRPASLATSSTSFSARGLYQDSLIVFVSDHGEEFFEHGSWMHGHSLYGELLNVPLDRAAGRADAHGGRASGASPFQHVDLMPTLLDYYDLERPEAAHGRSLLPGVGARSEAAPVFSALATRLASVVVGDWKLIERPGRPASLHRELFDLGSDPGELENLAARRPVVAGYLASLIRARRRIATEVRAPEAEIDPATLENLEALGYLN